MFNWGHPYLQNSSKWLLWMTSNRDILSSLSILGLVLAMFVLFTVAIIFGSHDLIW